MAQIKPSPRAGIEPAGELKIGQVGIANLRIRKLDPDRLAAEMRERIERAPKLFARAAVILDFSSLDQLPEASTANALLVALRNAGVHPVALAYGTPENDALAQQLGLPVLAKFRAGYEPAGSASANRSPEPDEAVTREAAPSTAATPAAQCEPGLVHTLPVRSGQQVFAANRDLTVLAPVGAGAEVLADGSIHVYGALRGRALAGASGFTAARILCREFHAELVAIAGHYKVLDDVPKELHGKAVQVWLDGDAILQIQPLA